MGNCPLQTTGFQVVGVFQEEQGHCLIPEGERKKGKHEIPSYLNTRENILPLLEKVGDAKVKVSCLFLLSPLLGMTAHSWQSLCFLGTSILRREESDNDAPSQRDCRPWWQLDQTEHPCPTFRSKEHSRWVSLCSVTWFSQFSRKSDNFWFLSC